MAKFPYVENTVRRNFHTAKFPYGENSERRKVHTAKIRYGGNSVRRKFHTAKNPTAKSLTAKIPATVFTLYLSWLATLSFLTSIHSQPLIACHTVFSHLPSLPASQIYFLITPPSVTCLCSQPLRTIFLSLFLLAVALILYLSDLFFYHSSFFHFPSLSISQSNFLKTLPFLTCLHSLPLRAILSSLFLLSLAFTH